MELGGKTFAPPHLPHMFGNLEVNLPHLPHFPTIQTGPRCAHVFFSTPQTAPDPVNAVEASGDSAFVRQGQQQQELPRPLRPEHLRRLARRSKQRGIRRRRPRVRGEPNPRPRPGVRDTDGHQPTRPPAAATPP
jgi:hypothetical protein